ncbi:MAG: glycosyltransferase [Candidatus Rhabdochlamydia sp.]
MKILKVIHGYPYRYNAGSEVYSQMLCHELVRQGHKVIVFTREENAYQREYSTSWEKDLTCPAIDVCLINMAHAKDGYRHEKVDDAFDELLKQNCPDVIHIGHLNHLSTSLIEKARIRNIPIVFTLHDFWLMCPRGQFLQGTNSKGLNLYPVCDSQEHSKCAKQCYSRYFSHEDDPDDLKHWSSWVEKRMDHVQEMSSYVDCFIAPSHYLKDRFIKDFNLPESKVIYLDYGFHQKRLEGRKREKEDAFVFGYIGTHKQAKGIFHLIEGFSKLQGKVRLKIWGSALEPFTRSLKSYVKELGEEVEAKIEWMGGYRNEQIVEDVFNHVDAIVVPSIWGENSPLVIHEALEAKVPVITADYGGMKEYIHHEINGLLFTHRDSTSLSVQMKRLIENPDLSLQLIQRGYIQSVDGHIPSIEEHTQQIIDLYQQVIHQKESSDDNKARSLAYHI